MVGGAEFRRLFSDQSELLQGSHAPPAGLPERVVEVYFKPDGKRITINRTPMTNAPSLQGDVGITPDGRLFLIESGTEDMRTGVTVEAMSKETLEPLFFPVTPAR